MAIIVPPVLRNADFAACLVRRYFALDGDGRPRYSGAHFERLGAIDGKGLFAPGER